MNSLNITRFNILKSLKERLYYGFQDILTASFVQGGLIIIPILVTTTLYGQYRGVLLITAPFALLNLSFSQVLLQNITDKSIDELKKFFHKLQFITIPFLIIILVGLFFLREPVLKIISKTTLNRDTEIIFVLICSIILTRFIYAGYEMVMVAINKQNYRFWIMLLGAIANIVAIFTLLPEYGLVGAIMTNVISSGLVMILLIITTEWCMKKKCNVRNFR